MSRHAKTEALLEQARAVLTEHSPMTVRQVYYQLVSRQVVENNRGAYQKVSEVLVTARREGAIPWEWIEDRTRQPHTVLMWDGLSDFAETARQAYRRDVWETQPRYVECWLEKDALSGIFMDVLNPYGVTLRVGRGYDGWASIHNAAESYADGEGVTVLYFGDFDPSGDDMVRSLRERLSTLGSTPDIVKCALTRDDIERYRLPPNPTKATDSRAAAFVAKHGDISVELDALPVNVLQDRIRTETEKRLDLQALDQCRLLQDRERRELINAFRRIA